MKVKKSIPFEENPFLRFRVQGDLKRGASSMSPSKVKGEKNSIQKRRSRTNFVRDAFER